MISIDALHRAFLQSSGACTDTRQLLPSGMFFALKGPNFDANALAGQALESGCAYAVVDNPNVVSDERFLLVPDVLRALQDLGRFHRRTFDIPVIGITGSNGKTTTKELVHAVLSADRPTLSTSGNLNNHIGVPLTLLRLTKEHRIAIIEMGANRVGDIAELTGIAEPTHGMITNIGRAHLEGFGSYEGVIKAKSEMYDAIWLRGGTLFVHGDDPLLMSKSEGIKRVLYGTSEAFGTYGATDEGEPPFLHVLFGDQAHEGRYHVETHLIGAYNTPNVLAAVCIGQHFQVPDEIIVRAIGDYVPSNNRSQFMDTGRNQLVLDAYNANPTSMGAALENFAAMVTDKRKLVVLGGMKELGADSRAEHERILSLVSELGLEAIYVGPEFMELADSGIVAYGHAEAALEALRDQQLSGCLVLVKGSRGTKLETLLPAF